MRSLLKSKFRQQLVRKIQTAYFSRSLLSARSFAVSSASAAFTLTSGSTAVSAQAVFEKGLIVFVSGMPIPK